ncbi:MAG: cupin domain-containing protein [Hyphomicrobiaceae bacterium]|nr:cupin domain-containing protein [Hyphomicrobiaceae bacterium]MCC0024315.1 cupin domain-containing protein [Hyphomicrobiaceae bacterium]
MAPRKINLVETAEQVIQNVWDPHVAGDVNESQIKIAKFGELFDWHSHANEDEAFLVLRGRIAIDFRDETVELDEGDLLTIPHGTEHRPRSLTSEPIVLMFEPAATLNTGDAVSDKTVTKLKRL